MRVSKTLRWVLLGLLAFLVLAAIVDRVSAKGSDDDEDDEGTVGQFDDDGDEEESDEPTATLDGLSVEQEEALRSAADKFQFQTEVSRMMKLIINSLYKNKEIFLRELISNASDALDKIRFIALTNKSALADGSDLKIEIKADKDKKHVIITDTGVGMTREELIKNLGTLAKSGTADFVSAVEQSGDMSLIGQFGVGFYSAFLVADKVTVVSKNINDDQHVWESTADANFAIFKDPRGNTLGRGTQITLHLKDEAARYLEENALKELVQKYSEFINFPIYLWTGKDENVDVPDEDAELNEDGTVPTKTVREKKFKFELQNENKPIWTRSAEEVTDEEYKEFYKLFAKTDQRAPMTWTHFKAEGEVEFKALLFVPAKPPSGIFSAEEERLNNIKLFVKRVFITDDVPELLPRWLKFLKGIVDSDDLPLNVSRETLQQHKLLRVIRRKLVRKAIELFKTIAENEEEYDEFLDEYHTSLKLGIIDDASNRKRLAELIRFKTSTSNGKWRSLNDYIVEKKKGQDAIFFLGGANEKEAESSPFLERLKARGYEVLFFLEPMDEYMVQALAEYEGYRFQNIAKEGLKFGDETDEDDDKLKHDEEKFAALNSWFTKVLGAHIDKTKISTRLTTSPAALIVSQFGVSGNMERIQKSQAYSKSNDPTMKPSKKTLEINPKHPVIIELLKRVEANEADDEDSKQIAQILYDTAALRSGFAVSDTVDFATRIEKILRANLNVDLFAQPEVDEKPAPVADHVDEDDEEDDHHHDEL